LPTGKSVEMKDGQLFHILSYGQGSMPSMAAQLSRADRWDAVNYVRSLQDAAKPREPLTETAENPE
jgi:mono/diheme cytochrome c family protein